MGRSLNTNLMVRFDAPCVATHDDEGVFGSEREHLVVAAHGQRRKSQHAESKEGLSPPPGHLAAREFGSGITVTVCPVFIETEMTRTYEDAQRTSRKIRSDAWVGGGGAEIVAFPRRELPCDRAGLTGDAAVM